MANEIKNSQTLASRLETLNQQIDKICEVLYAEKNIDLLPEFKSLIPKINNSTKLADISRGGIDVFQDALKRVYKDGMSDKEIIAACEKVWFYQGAKDQVWPRITHMHNKKQMEHIKKHSINKKGWKVYSFDRKVNDAIKKGIIKHRKKGDYYGDIIEKCMTEWRDQF